MVLKTIRVLPNPWASIDAYARPTGVVVREQADNDVRAITYVGAKLKAEELSKSLTRRIGKAVEVLQEARYERTWEFSTTPVELPAPGGRPTGYYLDRIRERALILADMESAKLCKMNFTQPALIIRESINQRALEYDAQHGPGAFYEANPELNPEESTPATERPEA